MFMNKKILLLIVLASGSALFFTSLFVFDYAKSQTGPVCGNNIVETGEACDDGNDVNSDACDTKGTAPKTNGVCTKTFCGDGTVQPAGNGFDDLEKCDEEGADTAKCSATCDQRMLGWAWSDIFGWLSLSCQNHSNAYPCPYPYGLIADTNNEITGWAWSDNVGWVCFGDTCTGYATLPPPAGQLSTQLIFDDPANPSLTGWANIISLGEKGWISLNCQNSNSCGVSPHVTKMTVSDFSIFSPATLTKRLALTGWGWSSASNTQGVGWVWFNPQPATINPWLQTKFGDIYAKSLTGSPLPSGVYSSSYRILAEGVIENFISAGGEQFWTQTGLSIEFPTKETRYANVLGRLDYDSLICSFNVNQSICQNGFGQDVIKITSASELPEVLGGKIYLAEGDLTFDSARNFKNGQNLVDGSGTVIVKGDLIINSDINYFCSNPLNLNDPSCTLSAFKSLASVAFIVKGDVLVNPGVGNLVGNYIVLGDDTAVCDADPNIETPGCGQFFSGYHCDVNTCNKRLYISGSVMARKFFLKRTYLDQYETVIEGSEVIIYDGRILANTPPGFADFAKALPVLSQ